MSNKHIFPTILFLVAVIFIILTAGLFIPIREKIDDFYLGRFAQKITTTDHVVASMRTLHYQSKEVSLSLTGEDAQRIVWAVSSAKANRRLNMSQMPASVTFFHGTNILAEISTDAELFTADNRRYLDVTFKPNADGGSGVLDDLIYAPLRKMVYDAEMKGRESQ